MLNPKQALDIILKRAKPLGGEEIDITSSPGRVLAERVYSDIDIPPFNRSAMDGFAINSKDASEVFEIIEDIPAGKVPEKRIKFGQCARIMTGAMLPKGANKVVKVEDTETTGSFIRIIKPEKKTNVSRRGEDIKTGQIILKKDKKLRPQEVAMLAAVGKTKVKVLRQPRIAIISTGSELVEPSQKPGPGQIRNSNSSMLLAQLGRLGVKGEYLGIAQDDFITTQTLVKKGLENSDILILSGGVSVGDYDFVRKVLVSCGVNILFDQVAVKPGKPTVFGSKGKKTIFGLPGNPVSVLIVFELFIVPLIDKITGRETKNKFVKLPLLTDFQRRDTKREQYYPVLMIPAAGVIPHEFHGSAHMHALSMANGIMRVKRGIKKIKEGALVDVRSI